MNKLRLVAGGVGLVSAVLLAYVRHGRRHVLNWGATAEEALAALSGDELLDKVAIQTTRAVTVNATPGGIWPWLLQMGPKPRAGVYTYDWIERLLGIDIENSGRLMPEFQNLEPGEFLPLNKKGDNGLVVRRVEAHHALVLQWRPANSTWAFVLVPQADGTTRLISRNRIPGSGIGFWLGMVGFMEPGSLIMERKMLAGIKDRVERLAAQEAGPRVGGERSDSAESALP